MDVSAANCSLLQRKMGYANPSFAEEGYSLQPKRAFYKKILARVSI